MENFETLEFCELPVCNLLGHNFFIPNYQRMYRWEKLNKNNSEELKN